MLLRPRTGALRRDNVKMLTKSEWLVLPFPPLENEDGAPDGDVVAMAKSRPANRAIIHEYGMGALAGFDFTFITDGADDGVIGGDQLIVEQVDVRARRGADFHDVFEEEKFFAGERTLGHAEPGISGQNFDDTNHRADACADDAETDEAADVSAGFVRAK